MLETSENAESTADRELVIQRTFDAPPALVFEAWTKAEHLAKWWGPNGFSITTQAFAFEVGGTWLFTLHGPDGKDYPNRIVYEEIVRAKRLVYSNYGGEKEGPAKFRSTVTFVAEGEQTRVTMRVVLPTARDRDFAVVHIRAIEGGNQTLERLAGEVAALAKRPAFRTTRVFDAPRRRVFEAWSKKEHLSKFLPPDHFVMAWCEMDFRPGGVLRFEFDGPSGAKASFEGRYFEIEPDVRIVFGGTVHDLVATTTLVFEDAEGGKTKLSVEQVYSAEGPATRCAPVGWAQTLDHLAALLAGA